jgi:hypothetical protein
MRTRVSFVARRGFSTPPQADLQSSQNAPRMTPSPHLQMGIPFKMGWTDPHLRTPQARLLLAACPPPCAPDASLDAPGWLRTAHSWNARHPARNRCYLYRARPALHRATPVRASHLQASHVSPWCAKMDEIEEDVSKRMPRERSPPTVKDLWFSEAGDMSRP